MQEENSAYHKICTELTTKAAHHRAQASLQHPEETRTHQDTHCYPTASLVAQSQSSQVIRTAAVRKPEQEQQKRNKKNTKSTNKITTYKKTMLHSQ